MKSVVTTMRIILNTLLIFMGLGISPDSLAIDNGKWKTNGWFASAPYGQSLLSDMNADFLRFDISSISNNISWDYSKSDKNRAFHTFGNIGVNIPIWNGSSADGKYGISVAMPACANIWLDIFEPATAPVVNTDYRIAAPNITFLHNINKGFFKNYSISLAPFKHESTHIGDELVLQRKEDDKALYRVNVSYNYTELRFTINEALDRINQCHTFRVGLIISHSGNWYFVEERDGDMNQVPNAAKNLGSNNDALGSNNDKEKTTYGPKNNPFEFYFQYQYQTPSLKKTGLQGIISFEYRNRARYGYDLYAKKGDPANVNTGDFRANTINCFIGLRYKIMAAGIRAYYGNCPYGMFRSIPDYSQIGFCLTFQWP